MQKNYSAVLSIDITGAFDAAIWSRIILQLQNLNCPPTLTNLVKSYLKDRAVLTSGGNGTPYSMTRGCPQGSVLGPLLWLLLAQELLTEVATLESDTVAVYSYADDFVIAVSGASTPEIHHKFRPIITTIDSWLSRNKLQISREKSTLTIIRKGNNAPLLPPPSIQLQGNIIPIKETFTCLGLTFNNTLTWTPHIDLIREKTYKIHQSWRIVHAKQWGVKPTLLKTWYNTTIEKIITYAAGIWAGGLTQRQKTKLLSIQRPFLLSTARAYSTTPSAALNILTGIPPLPLVLIKEHKLALLLRLQGSTIINDTNIRSSEIQTKTKPLQVHPSQKSFPHVSLTETQHNTPTHIYTDGSRSDDGTGAAFVVITHGEVEYTQQHRLQHYNSIFQAEALAILKALSWAKNNDLENITIHTDSRSTIQAILSSTQRDPLIIKIQNKLLQCSTEHRNYFITWIKAHVGIFGNEAADKLAKEAATSTHLPVKRTKMPISYVKHLLQDDLKLQWQSFWDSADTGRHLYAFIPKVSFKRLISTPWHSAFLTNHGPFAFYLHRFNFASSPDCVCGQPGDAKHYLFDCTLTKAWHTTPPISTNTLTWIARTLLHKDTHKKIKNIYQWLISNKIVICQMNA